MHQSNIELGVQPHVNTSFADNSQDKQILFTYRRLVKVALSLAGSSKHAFHWLLNAWAWEARLHSSLQKEDCRAFHLKSICYRWMCNFLSPWSICLGQKVWGKGSINTVSLHCGSSTLEIFGTQCWCLLGGLKRALRSLSPKEDLLKDCFILLFNNMEMACIFLSITSQRPKSDCFWSWRRFHWIMNL